MAKNSFGKSVLLSVLSIIVSVAMLIGVTYAVFNDDASTGINIIRTGSLDIDIVDADGESILDRGIMIASDSSPWEPGRWVSTERFYIKNVGDLDLVYTFSVTALNSDAGMFEWRLVLYDDSGDYSEFVNIDGSYTSGDEDHRLSYYNEGLPAFSDAVPAHLEGRIRDEATNDLMGKSVDGIIFTVHAKQTTEQAAYSPDAYNPYDSSSPYYHP